MRGIARKLTAFAVSASLIAASSVAVAAPSAQPAPAPVASTSGTSPWMALSAMTTSSSAASAALAQDNDGGGMDFPPWPVLAVILATLAVAIWILVDDDNNDSNLRPVSPD